MKEPTAHTLESVVADLSRHRPDAPALVAGMVRWTYRELDNAVTQAADALRSLGVTAGGGVGLLAGNIAAWPTIALGAHRAGARVDAFNTWVKAWDLDHLVASSRCSTLVMTPAVRSADLLSELRKVLPELWESAPGQWRSERFPALRHVVLLGDPAETPQGAHRWDEVVASAEPLARPAAPAPNDTAFVLYTSGSSAAPKAVPLLHRDLVLNGFHIGERMSLGGEDRVWLGSPLFWSFGSANALVATLSHGACLVLQEQFSAEEAAQILGEEHCTAAYLLPSMAGALMPLAEQVRKISSLRTGVTIGRPDEIRKVAVDLGIHEVCNIYGSTETYGNCCVAHRDAPLDDRLVSQGPPLPGVELRVVDDATGELRTADATGELHVRGRIMPGYLGQPKANAAAMTEDGWYRTGDRVTLRADGTMEFRSRLIDMIKTSGINVSPAEVEGHLCQHPAVLSAAVVGAPHPARGEVVVAFVTTRDDTIEGSTLREWCRERIAGYKVPWEIVVVPTLPSTTTGKILKRALVEDAIQRVASANSEPGANEKGNAR
ncbi:class I adenylate-forming enzyme family protein [Streptomyces sp. NPDC002917]|uniref:class I adenylate-forming enzyme family protein n=1 Tax=Streptomyces sp. NPDC002917 TaxID=3364671 RepID=UPI00368BCB3C